LAANHLIFNIIFQTFQPYFYRLLPPKKKNQKDE